MASRWNMEECGIYNPMSGITNNQSESFNSILKRNQGWKEIPVDSAILSLYSLLGMNGKRELSGLLDILTVYNNCTYH